MTQTIFSASELRRLTLQKELDAAKDAKARNRMGQYSTPTRLAIDILRYANKQLDESEKINFLDPAIGTGSFYSAFRNVFPNTRVGTAVGYEIDLHYGAPALELWGETELNIHLEDFTQAERPEDVEGFNLLICNPPYVRHHHIGNVDKKRLRKKTVKACGMELNDRAGLYCYFLGLSHDWMTDGGLAGWLLPSAFMDVNYGASVKRYLLDNVRLLQIHRFDPRDVQFKDALVSSVVVWFRKEVAPLGHKVLFTYGGSLEQPTLQRLVSVETLRLDAKWTRYPMKKGPEINRQPALGDFFTIRRGLATGNNSYFILSADEIKRRGLPMETFRPILPSPRHLPDEEVISDKKGNPVLRRSLFLLDCQLEEAAIRKRYPKLWSYLEEGKALGIAEGYLCKHRSLWYKQENRPPAPFLCTYLGRSDAIGGRPFRFILNHSEATAANVYLMLYPKPELKLAMANDSSLKKKVWAALQQIEPQDLTLNGRVYGGGLHKLEPRELANAPARTIGNVLNMGIG